MRVLVNTFYLVLLFNIESFAQLRLASAPVYKNFGTVNGYLTSGRIYKTIIDPYGYLWVGTEGGLFRYNGKSFETISLGSNDEIHNLDVIRKDLLLVLCHTGKTKGVNLKTRLIINTDSLFGLDRLLQDGRPYNITFKRGDTTLIVKKRYQDSINKIPSMVMLVGNKAFLAKNRKQSMQWAASFIFHSNHSVKVEQTIDQWIGSFSFYNKDEKLLVFNKGIYTQSKKDSSYQLIFDGNVINPDHVISCALLQDKQLFIGLLNGGLIRYNNYIDSGIKSSSVKLFKEELITDIIEDKNKNIWVSSYGNGLFLMQNQDLNSLHFNQKTSGISSDDILSFQKIDEQNTVSYSAANSIVETFGAQFHKKDSFSFWVQGIFAWGNNAYVLHSKGVYKSSYSSKSGMGKMTPFINIGGNRNLGWLDVVKWKSKQYCLTLSDIYILDSLGNYTVKPLPIKNGMSLLLLSDSDFLIGTTSGIYRNNKKLDWLPKTSFKKILLCGNELILCTRDGIFGIHINELNNSKSLYKIHNEMAYNVNISDDVLYFQTKYGIMVMDRQTKKILKDISFLNYPIPFNINDFFVDDHFIAVAGNKGIFYIPKRDFLKKCSAPQIYILNSLNNNRPADSIYQCLYNENLVAFFDLDILDNEKGATTIKYRILKDDEEYFDWTIVKESPLIRLNKPKPGEYRIEYLITHSDWEKVVKYDLTITPLWWQTILAKAIVGILFIVVIAFLVNKYIRLQQYKKTKKLRMYLKISDLEAKALTAQLNPHFIFNAMIPIQNMALKNDTIGTLIYVNKFSNLMRSILNKSRQKATPLNVEIMFLEYYLDVQKKLHSDKFSYSIVSDEIIQLSSTYIPSMLLQPLVENAVEHGVANLNYPGKITIEFISNNNLLHIKISDNGIGFGQVTTIKEGHAIKILIERLQLIKKIRGVGDVVFYDNENNSGGVSMLTLPLINNADKL